MHIIRQCFGNRAAIGITIHVDIFHHHQFGSTGSYPFYNSRLQRGEFFSPLAVFGLGALINGGRAFGQFGDIGGVVDIAFDDFDTGRQLSRLAAAVDHTDGFTHFDQFASNGFADGASP